MDLLTSTQAVLQECSRFLQLVSAESYTRRTQSLSGGTIGEHFRHSIEFYQCLLAQYQCSNVNYDIRERNHEIETDPIVAQSRIQEIMENLLDCDMQIEIKLISTIHPQGVPSNVARELLYNLEHLIHHLAIIRIAMREVEPDVELGAHFGVAPSTLLYRAEHKAHRN